MKIILLSLMMAIGAYSFSQEIRITVSAENKSITTAIDEDNTGKLLNLQTSLEPSEAYLVAKLNRDEIGKGWTRNFIIYDNEDNEVSRLAQMKDNTYGVALKNIKPLLKPAQEYSLYTIVLPEDPQKAMEVKVARQLICKIKID